MSRLAAVLARTELTLGVFGVAAFFAACTVAGVVFALTADSTGLTVFLLVVAAVCAAIAWPLWKLYRRMKRSADAAEQQYLADRR
jgi:membrane protein implicated in regulation of membrane protease activity